MVAIVSLLVILVFAVTVTKVAAIALVHTGLSRESARFQARSAFTGVGFTTSESENVVNHPVRRRIIMLIMILGNAGIVSAMSTLVIGMVGAGQPGNLLLRVALLLAGLTALLAAANSQWLNSKLSRAVHLALRKWSNLDVRDYASLLQLTKDYGVAELAVEPKDWLGDHDLQELELTKEGILVLAIQRTGGRFIGAPSAETRIEPGDTLILYGRSATLEKLDQRTKGAAGHREHQESAREHKRLQKQELKETENQPAETQQAEKDGGT